MNRPYKTDYKPARIGSPKWLGPKLRGWLRYQEGLGIGENPHIPGTSEFYLWQEGWIAGENGIEALEEGPL